MYCTHCGASNKKGAVKCSKCGQPLTAAPIVVEIPNHLVPAILCTVCCCLPFGIVSIVYAAQVNTKIQAGDLAGAQNASRLARVWAWVAFGCGAAISVLSLVIGGLNALLGHLH